MLQICYIFVWYSWLVSSHSPTLVGLFVHPSDFLSVLQQVSGYDIFGVGFVAMSANKALLIGNITAN